MALLKKLINPNVFAGAANSWDSMPVDSGYDPDNPMTPAAPDMPANAHSSVALSPAFNPNTSAQPDVMKDIYQPQLRSIGSQLQEAYNPPKMGVGSTLRHVLGAIVSNRNPQLGSIVSGDYGRQQKIAGLTKQYGLTEDAINQERTRQSQDITNRLHNAQADYFEQKPEIAMAPKPTTEEQDISDLMKTVNPATKKPYTHYEASIKRFQDVADTKPENSKGGTLTDLEIGGQNHKVLIDTKTGAVIKDEGKSKLPVPPANPGEHAFDTENAKQVTKDLTTARGADFRLRSMQGSYKDATEKNDQQAMLNLLTNHIGMTLGLQKGARITKDILHEATASAPWLQTLAAKFDSDGYLSGVTLTKGQMDSMMKLAHAQRHTAWQQAHDSAGQAGLTDKVQFPKDFVPEGQSTGASGATGGVKIIRDANGRIVGVE